MFKVLAEGYSFVHKPHLNPNFLIFPKFFTGALFLGFFNFLGFSDFKWANIGDIFRGYSEYIMSLRISLIMSTVLSLSVGISLVFNFLVTSAVNCTEFNLFLPLFMKFFI